MYWTPSAASMPPCAAPSRGKSGPACRKHSSRQQAKEVKYEVHRTTKSRKEQGDEQQSQLLLLMCKVIMQQLLGYTTQRLQLL
jgi:hypothetical protein